MLTCLNLSMRFGGKILFRNAHLQLDPKRRYGLIGANGSGKSTLIQLMTGEASPESGEISYPSTALIGSLAQDHYRYKDEKIIDIVLQGRPKLWEALQQKEELLSKNTFSDKECETLAHLESAIDYAAESEAAKLLEGLGIPDDKHNKNLQILSGGFRLRVLLAQLLFSKPDILLLDEPTNHLDLPSIKWLESYLKQCNSTLLISSHDRTFLNSVCTDMIDLDHQKLTLYKGNYDAYEETKALNQEVREAQLTNQEKKRDHLQGFIDRFRAKSSKARQAQSKMHLVKKLEKEMDELDLPPSSRLFPKLRFTPFRHSGAVPLKAQEISKSYGSQQVLHNVTFTLDREDRVCFVGPNGIGKSTLLDILTQNTASDSGDFEWGYATKYAYFPQDHKREVTGSQTLLEWLARQIPNTPEQKLRETLARVLFTGDDVEKDTDVLSGGETARLILAKMMLLEHNVLIFDEPTNHLDMEGSDALITSLQNYPGSLLIVSHNRYFISKIANRIIEMGPTGIKDFRMTFAEYQEQCDEDVFSARLNSKAPQTQEKNTYHQQKEKRREEAKLKRQFDECEKQCHLLEEKIQEYDQQMASDNFFESTPQEKINRLLDLKKRAEQQLDSAYSDWERLGNSLESN